MNSAMKGRSPIVLAAGAAVVAALVGLDVLAFLSGTEHHGGFWNSVPLGDLGLGAAGAGLLTWFALRVLKRFLSRPEDHYGERPRP